MLDCATSAEQQATPLVHGSDTSEAAARAVRTKAPSHTARVLQFIRVSGGATDDEVEMCLGLPHQSASARRNGLVRDGRLRDSGLRRKTRAGHDAVVWVVGQGDAVIGSQNDRAPRRPDAEEIRAFLLEWDDLVFSSDVARKMRLWLEHLANCKA